MIAFVLGGGGLLGAAEVGMLQALLEAGHKPDLVLGSSVGAINGAAVAVSPTVDQVEWLAETWESLGRDGIFAGNILEQVGTLVRTGTHLHSNGPLRERIASLAPQALIEELPVRFGCVAACIETARAHWFFDGLLTDAILASTAVPGLLPVVEIGDRHYVDGGLVDSIPIRKAIDLGATRVFVLQVGRAEQRLVPPKRPWEVATVAFEIARRNRFAEAMASIPDGLQVHVLPTGGERVPLTAVRYRDTSQVRQRISLTYASARRYLDKHVSDA